MPKLFIFFFLCLLIACDSAPQKTASMLKAEKAFEDAQQIAEKALNMLKADVINHPHQHLDEINQARVWINDARKVYVNAKIKDWSHSDIEKSQAILNSLHPAISKHSLNLTLTLIEKTLALRKQIEEAKNRPYLAKDRDPKQIVSYLGSQYNENIETCCLGQIGIARKILSQDKKAYLNTLTLTSRITTKLERVIKEPAFAKQWKSELEQQLRHHQTPSPQRVN